MPNTLDVAPLFDKAAYHIRETANLLINLHNTGKFSLDSVTVDSALPDLGFTNSQTIAIDPGYSLDQLHSMPIPETLAAGEHGGSITLSLPGGSVVSKNISCIVPTSALTLTLEQTAFSAGETIAALIRNSGGVDTAVQYRLSLYDATSKLIAEKSGTEAVMAGVSLPVTVTLTVPGGAADGAYSLVVNFKDTTTSKEDSVTGQLAISGVKGTLTVQTDKQSYLATESIAGLSSVSNSGTPLQGGNLHLQVSTAAGSQKQKTWTSQYDFQQGVRDGVDTYGVNDWLIPDDDFEGAALDTSRWTIQGNVSLVDGKAFVDSRQSQAAMIGTWQLEGDFDVQVEFAENNGAYYEGVEMGVAIDDYYNTIKNTPNDGYLSGLFRNNATSTICLNRTGPAEASSAGTLRIVRTGHQLVNYYRVGVDWKELLRCSTDTNGVGRFQMYIWRGAGYATSAKFDNFKVNSGRIKTENQTVDSVRLLPQNDNFDNGMLNEDRWNKSGDVAIAAGKLTANASQLSSGVTSKWQLQGDFDIQVDFENSNSAGESGTELHVYNSNFFFFIKNSELGYFSGLNIGGDTIGGIRSGSLALKGKLRLVRSGQSIASYYFDGFNWTRLYTASYPELAASANILMYVLGGYSSNTFGYYNNFKVNSGQSNNLAGKYVQRGTLNQSFDAGLTTEWGPFTWTATQPIGTTIKFRTRSATSEAALTSAAWSDYLTASGSAVTSPAGRWIEIEATLETADANITPLLHDVTVTYGNNPGDILWQADLPENLAQGAVADLTNAIGTIGTAGKYYLQGTLTSNTGQTVTTAEYPFYVVQGNTLISLGPDKKLYKPGETVTVSGEVKNLATIEAANLTLAIKAKPAGGADQTINTTIFTLPAGGSRPFSVTTAAGAEGIVTLSGTVTQNSATLAAVGDQYEVAAPKVTASLSGPDSAGSDPFTLSLTLVNSGKTDALIVVAKSFSSPAETITVPAGQTRILQYLQQIAADTSYVFTLTGDISLQLTKTIVYVVPAQATKVSAKTVTDRISYRANELVAITATVTCLESDTTGDSLAAVVMIGNSSGEIIFADRIDLPQPYTGRIYQNSRYWNTATYPPGVYSARLVVEAPGGALLANADTTFTILPSSASAAGVTGSITPVMNQVYLGIDQSLAITLANNGNENLPGATYTVLVVNPDTGSIIQTYSKTVALPLQGSVADSLLVPTGSLEERDYLAVLQITLPGMAEAKTLAGAPFGVKIAPPPTLLLSTLSNGAVTNNQTLNISGSATGAVAMKSLTINATDVALNSDGSFSHALLLQTGDTVVTTIATDILDHTAIDSRTITLDQQAPLLTIDSPADNGKTALTPIEVTGRVDETSTVTITVNGITHTVIMNGTDFSATVLPVPGWNTIEITATDLAGNPGSQKRSVLFDDQKPSLAITEPAQDIRTNKSSVTISGTATDPYTAVGITVAMDGNIMTPPVVNNIFAQVVAFSDEKLYPITVTATNEVGTQSTAQRNVIFDKTPPNLTIDPVVTPTNTASQTVTGTREEGTAVTVTCASATVGAVEYPEPASWSVSLAGLQLGENRLLAEAYDLADNRTTAVTSIQYVPKAPEVTISADPKQLWPPNKKLIPITITGNVVTFGTDLKEITISVADEYGTYNQQGLKFGDTVLLEAWREGNDMDGRMYTITAVVTDQAGNRAARSTTVVVPHDMGK